MSRIIDLLDYIPPVLADAEEQKQIFKALNPEINILWSEIQKSEDNQFIDSSNEYGVSRRENQLKIKPKNTETLSDRKFRLLARENEKLPYTYRVLDKKLESLCGENGYTLNVDTDNEILKVRVDLSSKYAYEEVRLMLEKMCPLNYVIDLALFYNSHRILSRFTHTELSKYTHKQLREEVLANE